MIRFNLIEITDGNLKSILRLILALAAHFKPANIQYPPNKFSNSSNKQNSVQNSEF